MGLVNPGQFYRNNRMINPGQFNHNNRMINPGQFNHINRMMIPSMAAAAVGGIGRPVLDKLINVCPPNT
jgi:hypothetical protein